MAESCLYYNLERIFRKIVDEKSVVAFLQQYGITVAEKKCISGQVMQLGFGMRGRRKCCALSCRHETDIRKNNWLESSQLPLETTVEFIYLLSVAGPDVLKIL